MKKTICFLIVPLYFYPRMDYTNTTTTGAGISAVRNIDRLIFGGQCERGEFDNLTAYAVADQLRDAVCAFFRAPSKDNAFRVFDLRGTHQRTGTIDIAFSRIAEVYRFHRGPYYQTESGMD